MRIALSFSFFFSFLIISHAQTDLGSIKGNFESSMQLLQTDSAIKAYAPESKTLINSYLNVFYRYKNFKAGGRFESYLPHLQGYPDRFNGNGVGMRFAGYADDKLDITIGNFYDQFGSGMIFRAYENRALGYDNAMDGVRISYRPLKGVLLKGVYGKNRFNFDSRIINASGLVRGIDGEIFLNEAFKSLDTADLKITLGASFVSKFQKDDKDDLILPQNVGSYGGRVSLDYKKWSASGEYIIKENDPSADNNYIYNKGHAALFNLGYSQKGLGILLTAKSVDNMSFRSDRTKDLQDVFINYLPSLNRTHTYNLVATLYPYATQPLGEVAYQGEVIYTFKKTKKGESTSTFIKTLFKGKYPATFTVNFSTAYGNIRHATSIEKSTENLITYRSNPFEKSNEMYWQDFNIEYRKKFGKFTLATSYYNITVNNDVSKVTDDAKGLIHTSVGVVDLAYEINEKNTIRIELQGMKVGKNKEGVRKDKGDWVTGVAEWTVSPNWFFAIMDQYNVGNGQVKNPKHYVIGSIGYIMNASRFSINYGRQRAGLFCVGGVCRFVPANNGLSFNITHTF